MKLAHLALTLGLSALAHTAAAQSRQFTIEPASPTAFEPLTMLVDVIDSCESVAPFRPIAGGFRVELDGATNEIFCDSSRIRRVSLGAYPPGTYRIELGRTAAFGGTTYSSLDVVVRPGMTEPSRYYAGGEDLSGLWFSPSDEPSTGMTFVHTGPNGTPGARETLIGIWYRYGADGMARWYWIETTTSDERNFTGSVFAYNEVNPAAVPAQRTVSATPIGTVQITFPGGGALPSARTRVTGTVDGELVDFRLERFRWSRAAWPQVPQ